MARKSGRYLRRNKLFKFSLITLAAGVLLLAAGLESAGNWVLGAMAVIGIISLTNDAWQELKAGRYGADILSIVAAVSALGIGEYLTAALVIVVSAIIKSAAEGIFDLAVPELRKFTAATPKTARLLRGRKEVEMALSKVGPGDKLLVRAGELVPVDGTTQEGDIVQGGTVSRHEVILRATATAENSQYRQINRTLGNAVRSDSPYSRTNEKFVWPFTLLTLAAAAALGLATGETVNFLKIVVIATPVALIYATNIALSTSISRAAGRGIFIKSGSVLQRLAAARSIIIGKNNKKLKTNADRILAVEQADRPTVYAGDGIEEAPVLTAADVGIALGAKGHAAAGQAAAVIIMDGKISLVDSSIILAKKTLAIARLSVVAGTGLSLAAQLAFATGDFSPELGAILKAPLAIAALLLPLLLARRLKID